MRDSSEWPLGIHVSYDSDYDSEEDANSMEIDDKIHEESDARSWEDMAKGYWKTTEELRRESWPNMKNKVIAVLDYMKKLKINLPILLDAVSFGHDDCRNDYTINSARVQLICSNELPKILEQWYMPPKSSPNSKRPIGAKWAFQDLAIRVVKDRMCEEMEDAASNFLRTNTHSLLVDDLQVTTYEDIIHNIKIHVPVTFDILVTCATGAKERKKSKIDRRENE